MAMSFCKKSVHSFLNVTNIVEDAPWSLPSSPKCGLGLITSDTLRPPNVIESSYAIKFPTAPSSPLSKKDPGGVGFIDDIGGGVDGLMSCTESLGFESSDERRFDGNMECFCEMKEVTVSRRWRRTVEEKRERKTFPPPLPSLNQNGQPCFFLRPVRRDGRLELTEVRIERAETLRVHREGGRLRLHLVRNESFQIEEQAEEEEVGVQEDEEQELKEEQENELQQGDEEENEQPKLQKEEEEEEENEQPKLQKEEEEEEENEQQKLQEEEEEEEEGKELEKRDEEYNWGYRVGGGEELRRCHEVVMSHHHHPHHRHHHHISHHHNNLHVWGQHCVTTR